jgi:hypothetical protein
MAWRRAAGGVTYRRQGGTPPPDFEQLDLPGDGTFSLWRTIARASRPPSPVGRFRGRLDGPRRQAVDAAVAACAKAGAVALGPPAGAALDKVTLGRKTASWAEDQTPPPPWDALAALLRELLGELTTFPLAAVTVQLAGDGATLAHLGTEPIELDLSGAQVRAVRWEAGVAVGTWQAEVDGPGSVNAGPGWAYPLPFDHGFPAAAVVTAHVDNLLAFDGQFWRACSLQSPLPT